MQPNIFTRYYFVSWLKCFQAWGLYEKGELVYLVDSILEGNFDTTDACKHLKIGLLCTQDVPSKRPTMSIVVKMLKGEIDVDQMELCKTGRFTSASIASQTSSDKSMSQNSSMTHGTMTFNSIYD